MALHFPAKPRRDYCSQKFVSNKPCAFVCCDHHDFNGVPWIRNGPSFRYWNFFTLKLARVKKMLDVQQCFAFTPQANFPALNLNFHSRWRWWNWIQDIFLNLFYFTFYVSMNWFQSLFIMYVFQINVHDEPDLHIWLSVVREN